MADINLAGENAIIVYFGKQKSPLISQTIAFYHHLIKQELADIVIDCVPSYTSLLITYRVTKVLHDEFCALIKNLMAAHEFIPQETTLDHITIPVLYDASVGLDLDKVLNEKQLSLDALIKRHTAETYYVYAIGFSPAFAFLGQLHPDLHQPRHATPRLKVPAGSVGIADDQTGIYPIDSPGGWHIIGKTPWDLSLNKPENINRFQVGQQVTFKAVDAKTFAEMGGVA